MSDFNTALRITLHYEGGYSNNKADSGGMTIAGISRNNNPNAKIWAFVDAYIAQHGLAHISADLFGSPDFMALVGDFYKANYWDVNRLSDIKDQQLANVVFDFGVNSGTGRSARFLQQAVNMTTTKTIAVDGAIGNGTIAAVNSLPAQLLYSNFNKLREDKYNAIIAANPSQAQFKDSWFSRIKDYVV